MRLQFAPYNLIFKFPAGTSRGILTEKITCFIRIFDETNPKKFGVGEAGVFPGLSVEANDTFFYKLMELQANIRLGRPTDLSRFPSLQSGLEQAIRDFSGGCRGIYFDTPFVRGEKKIKINGLIWMDTYEKMKVQIDQKIKDGFKCIKLKIGAIDWKNEINLIRKIRKEYSKDVIEIRVDANGAFHMDEALVKLKVLADLGVHSIEQPIKPGNPDLMAFLCSVSPLPIALDEELIGKFTIDQKIEMLNKIHPKYLVLKPSLVGGYSGCEEWIRLAEERDIGWWITSALESNIGLNALSQWVATLSISMPQGLGTGSLYKNNFESPLFLEGQYLGYNSNLTLNYEKIDKLDWRE